MTREQIRQHQDRLDRLDTISERIFIGVCVASTVVWVNVLVQVASMVGGW